MLSIYADGSSTGKSDNPGGYGYVILRDGKPIATGHGGDPSTTNNRMELQAAISGLAAPTGVLPAAGDVRISVGGLNYSAVALAAVPQLEGATPQDLALVTFVVPTNLTLDPAVRPPAISIKAGTGTRLSAGYLLNVATVPAAQ